MEGKIMLHSVSSVIGSVLLALGVMSPAMGRVNEHSSALVFFGLSLLVLTVIRDSYNNIDR